MDPTLRRWARRKEVDITSTTKKRHLPDLFDISGKCQFIETRKTSKNGSVLSGYPKVTTDSTVLAGPQTPRGSQITTSENHPTWGESIRHGSAPPGDVGGDFFTQKSGVSADDMSHQYMRTEKDQGTYYQILEYKGPIYALYPDLEKFPVPPQSNLTATGTTAIARCSPTNRVASAAAFLSELYRDGLPHLFGSTLWQSRVSAARSLGDEYLNKEFGWDPLVGDVQSFAFAAANAHTVLSQYERDSGQVVRRRYVFPAVTTQTTSLVRGQDPLFGRDSPFVGQFYDPGLGRGNLYKTTRTWRQAWFSGAFTYYIPSDYYSRFGLIESANKAEALLGLDLTPESLYQAAPWSWAIDWFTNMGDVVANLSSWSTDGLVLRYGYVMEHSFATDTYFLDGLGRLKAQKIYPSPVTIWSETKRRQKATPFGFGLTWTGLTLRQKAIALALGLTHH